MGIEEQTEEREVLSSIFPDEINDISPSSYTVTILLDLPSSDDESTPTPAPPALLLSVSYPSSYPDIPPDLDIHPAPIDLHPKHVHLDISSDKSFLLNSLEPVIAENIGIAMIYTLISSLKDSAEELIGTRIAAVQDIVDRERTKAEEEENRKFEGLKVDKESWMAWRERFRAEMEEERLKKEKELEDELKKRGGRGGGGSSKDEKKLTGKELWERGLAGKIADEDEEDDGEEHVVQIVKKGLEDLTVH